MGRFLVKILGLLFLLWFLAALLGSLVASLPPVPDYWVVLAGPVLVGLLWYGLVITIIVSVLWALWRLGR